MGFQAVVLTGATFSWIIVCVGKWGGLCNISPSPFPPASPPRWHFGGMPRKGNPRGTVKKQHNPEQPWGCSELHQGLNLPPASLRIQGVHRVWHSPLSPHSVVNWYSRASESKLNRASLDSECCSREQSLVLYLCFAQKKRPSMFCLSATKTYARRASTIFPRCGLYPNLQCTEVTTCLQIHSPCQPSLTLPGQVQVGKSIEFLNRRLLLEDVSFAVQDWEDSNTGSLSPRWRA